MALRAALIFALAALSLAQVRLPGFHPQTSSGGGGGGAGITSANFTNPRTWRMPSSGYDTTSLGDVVMGGYNSGGVTHLVITQTQTDTGTVGIASVADLTVVGTGSDPASWASATQLTCSQNWGRTGSGCASGGAYDMWGGKFPYSFDGSGNPINLGGVFVTDVSAHVVAGGVDFIIGYAGSFSNYVADWHKVLAHCTAPGTCTQKGPFRFVEGIFDDPGGPASVGPRRSGFLFECPLGMCDGMSTRAGTQTAGQSFGDSIFAFNSWLTTSTPDGFGSSCGTYTGCRTTDITADHTLLSRGNLTNLVSSTTGLLGGGHSTGEVLLRPQINGSNPYLFESYNGASHTAENYVDPDQYGGVGTWIPNSDYVVGATYADLGGQASYLFLYSLATHSTYYQQVVVQTDSVHGTTFDRTVDNQVPSLAGEADLDTSVVGHTPDTQQTPGNNMTFRAALAGQHYNLRLLNPGPSHGTTDCGFSSPNFTITLKTDGSSNVLSTVADVVTAVTNTSACSTRMSVTANGSGTDPLIAFGYVLMAQGPIFSPRYGIYCYVETTGPCRDLADIFIGTYEATDLEQTPDYTPQPSHLYSVNGDLNANFHFRPYSNANKSANDTSMNACGMYFDSVTGHLFICAEGANDNDNKPLVHEFTMVSLMPGPNAVVFALPLLAAVFLAGVKA